MKKKNKDNKTKIKHDETTQNLIKIKLYSF